MLVSPWGKQNRNRQFKILEKWAQSEEGRNLYLRLVEGFQYDQTVEQFTLNVAALMSYRRLHPDSSDDSNQPITDSYITDLDALLCAIVLGNSGRVAERMVLALSRTLQSRREDFHDLIVFLETTLACNPRPLHVLDGLSDEYVRLRMDGLPHQITMTKLAISYPQIIRSSEVYKN